MAVQGEVFGQKRPPLYRIITNILREYPCGQIFKEIIQNADDAGATEVKFYLDCRNFQTLPPELVDRRVHDELERFQGLALMSCNNAPFNKEDWENIQSLQQSGKAKNPHKVGKFGIGFNSVYHITDLPLIISGDYCAFLEPQEHIWKGESGRGYYLKTLQSCCPQALLPYDGVCGFSMQLMSFANKTLFRFPLRHKPSKLSNEMYSVKKVRKLLQVLKAEAKYLLLFLRSVCSIEVMEISECSSKSTFKVSVSSREALGHQQQQQSLVEQVETNFKSSFAKKIIHEKCIFQIEIEDGGAVNKHKFIVVNRVGSEDPEVLALAEKQHVLPWVGTAFEVSQAQNDSGGCVFCFLPLPSEDRAPFSVHVNGTFAVSGNRRSLNWESQERQGDQEATWNTYLVERCIPACYAELVEEVVRIPSIAPNVVYNCWPVISKVRGTPWEGVLRPLFEKLLYSDNAVHTNTDGGQWISIANSIFVPEGKTLPQCVNEALVMSGMKVVELSCEQWSGIKDYYKSELQILCITPSVVRRALKQNPDSYINQSHQSKHTLLQYCISDKNYSDLADLKLIPLANGSFGVFQVTSSYHMCSQKFYVCSHNIRQDLLPGLEHILIDLLQSDSITHSLLKDVAESGDTQLTLLTEYEVAKLLPQSNTHTWSQNHLANFWKWLQGYDLSTFKRCEIVPVKNTSKSVTIQCLSMPSSLIYVSRFTNVSQALREALENYGIKFACVLDFPYLSHPHLHSCVFQFKAGDVLDAMPSNGISTVQLTDEQSLAMQTFLSGANTSFKTISRVDKICDMNIFSVLHNHNTRYSINQLKTQEMGNRALVQGEGFYFRTGKLPNQPLIISDGNRLLKNLSDHVSTINGVECLEKIVFPSIRNGCMTNTIISEIMTSVLDNLQTFVQRYPRSTGISLTSNLSSLPFVTVESGQLKSPSSLFNPESELLMELYKGEPVFPSGEFVRYTNELRLCGLRGTNSVTAANVYEVICKIQLDNDLMSTVQCDDITYTKAIGVFNFLTAYPHLLGEDVKVENGSCLTSSKKLLQVAIAEQAKTHALLPVAIVQPYDYPSCLRWKGSEHSKSLTLFSSKNTLVLSGKVHSNLVQPGSKIIGSEAVFVENMPSAVCQQLSSSGNQLADAVVRHFRHVLEHEKDIEADILEQIALQTYQFLCSCGQNVINLKSIDKWVWVESCSAFVRPEICALSTNPSFKISLEPFVYVLPNKMERYDTLLCTLGVKQYVTTEQIVSVLTSIKERSRKIKNHEAWSFVRNILEWVANNQIDFSNILVPIESEDKFPELYPADEVSYTDNELLLEIAESSDDDYKLVHHKVRYLASQFGLTPLSDQLDITEEVFQDAGQHEPLTTRLSNILKEYKDGITIIKEMIQNADDAEATVVNILFDARNHTTDKLLFKGMADSHGPALVVHNNAVFTKEDFANITKLAGATKKDEPLKIGKFGVGFCSVYHITDVPSFVSNDWLYIFDPTLKHLKGVVKNENQPGKRVKYSSKYLAHTQQLAPYNGLFGFDRSDTAYNGTMFRFPFRKYASQISSTIYNENLIKQLEKELVLKGKEMLLFLNHVKKITFQSIGNGSVTPTEVIVIQKTECDDHIFQLQTACKMQGSEDEFWVITSEKENLYHIHEKQERIGISSVACRLSKPSGCYKVTPVVGSVFCFLPLSVPSTGLPVHISANLAVMSNRSGIWTSDSSSTPSDAREWWNQKLMETVIPAAYCKILTMLKCLCEKGELLDYDFFTLFPLTEKLFTKIPWKVMIKSLYSVLSIESIFYSRSSGKWLTLSESKFLSPKVLAVNSSMVPECVTEAINVMKLPVVYLPQPYLFQLELLMEGDLNILGQTEFCITFISVIKSFSSDFELRNKVLFSMFVTTASEVVSTEESELLSILKNNPCVPCKPNGKEIKLVSDLVDPNSELSELFVKDSGMFPIVCFTDRKAVHQLMISIGLLTLTLPWNMVLERAKSIPLMYKEDITRCLNTVRILIKVMEENIDKEKSPLYNECVRINPFLDELKQVNFIPVAEKPEGYFLLWKGENITLSSPSKMFYPNPLFEVFRSSECIERECHLLGTQKIIVNCLPPDRLGCGGIPHNVLSTLGFQTRPCLDDVLSNYQDLIKGFRKDLLEVQKKVENIECICRLTYEFLNNELKIQIPSSSSVLSLETVKQKKQTKTKAEVVLSAFCNEPFIWTGESFVSPEDIALNWKENGPYLYKLPSIISEYKSLIETLCIEERFCVSKLLNTLQRIKFHYDGVELPKDLHKTVDTIICEFNLYQPEDFETVDEQKVVLPSCSYVLHWSKELVVNDSPWLPLDNDEVVLLHPKLNRQTALALKVNTIRSKFLDKYSKRCNKFGGVPFGQREELTQRIKNILRDYPMDVTLVKELLQNADDAKASKMCIIIDKRTHGTKRTPFEKPEELQGPAVLVWNNAGFSEKDLDGIQRLGLGSKRDDPESLGHFGIGFNVAYHLTDCPSFITDTEGGTKTLCVFDPHCYYTKGADFIKPGERYDDLDDKFWDTMSDLKSAYLQIKNQPPGLNTGSLFRFPLRQTNAQIMHSKIVEDETPALTAADVESKFNEWVLQIKDALIFLNCITELSYYVVEESGFHLKAQYKVTLNDLDGGPLKNRNELFSHYQSYRKDGTSDIFNYHLTIDYENGHTLTSSLKHTNSQFPEEWFVQQGIGDLDNKSSQKENYIHQMLPKHGIAALHNPSSTFEGRIFYVLPLPIKSGLPVHINGQFVLNSNRRSLWVGEDEGQDEKKEWNESLIEAIASSYVRFLIDARSSFLKDEEYEVEQIFYQAIQKYYGLYPFWLKNSESMHDQKQLILDRNCMRLAQLVFTKLQSANPNILATEVLIEIPNNLIKVEWLPLKNEDSPHQQVYFKPLCDDEKSTVSLLRKINLTFTCAPHELYDHLSAAVIATPESVFQFYCDFYEQHIFMHGIPCHIEKSPFKTVETFCQFIKYLLNVPTSDSLEKAFPGSPFGYPLLLTADECVRCLNQHEKVMQTNFCSLFPKSLHMFLHIKCSLTKLSSTYYYQSVHVDFDKIWHLLEVNYSLELQQDQCNNIDGRLIETETLKKLWECLCSEEDTFLQNHQQQILSRWALIPAINKCLYRASSQILPVRVLRLGPGEEAALNILLQLGLPVLDFRSLPSVAIVPITFYSPEIIDYNKISDILFNLQHRNHIFDNLLPVSAGQILSFLGKTGFSYDVSLRNKVGTLPLFKPIQGPLTNLSGKDVYLWPQDEFCIAGYNTWAPIETVLVLEYNGDWRKLTHDFTQIGSSADVKDIYLKLIFPVFSELSPGERKSHLIYIRENVFMRIGEHFETQFYCSDKAFVNRLMELPCIECCKTHTLKCISEFNDHTVQICSIFSKHFSFLSEDYHDDEWIDFFRYLGLRVKITAKDFIKCCLDVSQSNRYNLEEASQTLLTYLFKEGENWEEDDLRQIGKIEFVLVDDLLHHSWIKPPCSPPQLVNGVGVAKLNEAVLPEFANLVWTVRPVIKMQEDFLLPVGRDDVQSDTRKLLLVSPEPRDVIRNLINISKCDLTNIYLHHQYRPQYIYKEPRVHILVIVTDAMKFLQKNYAQSKHLLPKLKKCAIIPIPVESEDSANAADKVVLVKPRDVVQHFTSPSDKCFVPYIHEVPDFLQTYRSILQDIGVLNSIKVVHIQHLLKELHQKLGRSFADPNQLQLIRYSMIKLVELCRDKLVVAEIVQLLYLPSVTGNCWTLKNSAELVFADSTRYKTCDVRRFKFEDARSLFCIPPDFTCRTQLVQQNFDSLKPFFGLKNAVTEQQVCRILPKILCPKGLSLCTQTKMLQQIKNVSDCPNIILASLSEMKKFIIPLQENILPNMLKFHLPKYMYESKTSLQFVSTLVSMLVDLEIVVVEELQADVYMGDREIGRLTYPRFVLEKLKNDEVSKRKYALFLDSGTTPENDFWFELSRSMLIELGRMFKSDSLEDLIFAMAEPIQSCLQVQSQSALRSLGQKYNVQLPSTDPQTQEEEDAAIPSLGSPIQDELKSKLCRNESNIFYPHEWVGYERIEDVVRWAIVLSSGSESDSGKTYRILLDEGDKIGFAASVVDLHKLEPCNCFPKSV